MGVVKAHKGVAPPFCVKVLIQMSTRKATPLEVDKFIENYLRRKAKAMGYLLRRSHSRDPWAEEYLDNYLYVLVDDCRRNRFPFARFPAAAFERGEGKPLKEIAEELGQLERLMLAGTDTPNRSRDRSAPGWSG